MPSEPNWSKNISNSNVCTWFYALSILNLLFGLAGVLSSIYLVSLGRESLSYVFLISFAAMVGFTNSWFFFLMCNRGLR